MIVPMFPLPGVYLFPNAIMPLRVFEPRYKAMVEDLLDTAGRLVVASIKQGHESEAPGKPPVDEIAGLGEITRHERLPNGEYIIVLQGLGRHTIEEVPSDTPYRRVKIEPLAEITVPEDEQDALRDELIEAVRARSQEDLDLPAGMGIQILTDLLLMQMQVPPARMTDLFGEPIQSLRARGALREHERLSS